MKKTLVLLSIFFLVISAFGKKKEAITTRYQFIKNNGQFHANSQYRVSIPNGMLFLESNTFTYHFFDGNILQERHHGEYQGDSNIAMNYHAYKVKFENANPTPQLTASKKTPNYYNFFRGKDRSKWAGRVPAYEEVEYNQLYPGINLKMYKHTYDGLKYDLIVAPNANPSNIQVSYTGVDSIYLKGGKLYVITSLNENWEEKPEAWQIINGKKQKVTCKYHLEGNVLSYTFPNSYNKNHELIIDPIMVFSSYSGSFANNFGYTATYDKFGFLYSGSTAFGVNYPTTLGAFQTTYAGGTGSGGTGGTDIAITKWDTTGTFLIYSTYLGGTSDEAPHSLVVSEFSELYVMGTTGSTDFPTTINGFDTSFNIHNPIIPVSIASTGVFYQNGSDIVVTKLDSSGSNLLGSTYLGGTNTDGVNNGVNTYNYADEFRGEIDIDKKGKVYIVSCTRSDDNPVTASGFQNFKLFPTVNHIDGIVYKLNHDLSALEWTNYIGGNHGDAAYSIAINKDNDIYITGGTYSPDFPVTANAFDTTNSGVNDAFISKISEDGNTLLSSTYYGSAAYDQSYFVELDFEDNPHIFGQTSAAKGLLIHNALYHDSLGGQLITKFKPELDSVIWSTRFGTGSGIPNISPTAFLVDVCSAIYLSGWGSTTGMDTAGGPFQGTTDGMDFYLMVLSADANSLQYGSFIGGVSTIRDHVDGGTSRFDRKGKIYQAVCAGCGNFDNFPTFPNPGAWSNTNNTTYFQGCNLAVFKMDFLLPIVIADFDAPTAGCAPLNITFDNVSKIQSLTTYLWDFGDGTTSTAFEPNHIYTVPGVYTIKLFVSDAATCNLSDSTIKTITILSNTSTFLPNITKCNGSPVEIGVAHNIDPSLSYQWNPTTDLSDTSISNPLANPLINTAYTLIIDNGVCFDTVTQWVEVDSISTIINGQSNVCSHDAPFTLTSITQGFDSNYIWSNFPGFSDTIPSLTGGTSVLVSPLDSANMYYLQVISSKGCLAIDSFQMVVQDLQNPITARFSDPGTSCAPAIINFSNTTDSLSSTTYIWSFGDGGSSTISNPSNVYPNKGTYTVTLIAKDTSICPQADTFSMEILIRADSSYTVNSTACLNQESEIGIPADTTAGATYSWYPSNGLSDSTIHNPTVNISADATYLLIVNNVCVDSVWNTVTVSPIFAETDSLLIICSDNPIVNQVGNSNGTGLDFVWSTQSDLSDTLNTSLSDSTLSTNQLNTYQYYYFHTKSAQGCEQKDSVYVVVSDQTVTVSGDTFICQDDTILLQAVNLFPENVMDYYWTPSNQIIGPADTAAILVAPIVSTSYYLAAINDSGCTYIDSILVAVSLINDVIVQATSSDDSVLLGFHTILNAFPGSGYNYNWTPISGIENPNQSATQVSPNQTTTYSVNISDPNNTNCSYSSEVTIHVYEINCGEPDIFIPNAFSPNGDGANDSYLITGKVVEEIDLKIYNRWGELVFETTDPNKGWDGTFNGKEVDPLVFVYNLSVTCIDRRAFIKKGNITVIR